MDRIEEWRILASVGGLRSFVQAARALGRSPQVVTRAIAALEARLGTRLLHRTTRSVSLTNDGERYLQLSRRALAEFDRLESGESLDAPLAGKLSIAAPVLFGQLHLMPVVTEFLASHPALDARVTLLDRVVALADEGIDVALRIGNLSDSALRSRSVGHVRSIVCASPEYLARAGVPRTPDELAGHDCIAFTGSTPIPDRWSFPEKGRRDRTVAVRATLTVNTGQAAIDAAVAGVGIVRVLSYQIADLVAEKKLMVLLNNFRRDVLAVNLVHLPGIQTRAAAEFIEFAASRIRERLERGARSAAGR